MSFVRMWMHLVFSTRNREPLLDRKLRHELQKHIMSNCKGKGIFLVAINGYSEHLHCLISLGKDQTIAKVAQLIKGESSHWINENNFTKQKFNWQDDYFAASVSQSQVEQVIGYIKKQEAHHAKTSFADEAEAFMNRYGWEKQKEEDFG